ncbi:MAG TPA: zf-HC2 domain-containing protein [Terriglobales bacterium]|nr:zf-HC2 domain-containing protein [Terriglobales bacterium]
MGCEELIEHLSAYLDGDGEAGHRLELEAHLHSCPVCRSLVDTCRQTIRVFRGQALPELPAALHERVMARVRRENKL